VRQDEDVLDTWFSSWLWPFATMGWPEQTEDVETFYPGSTLVTAPDIIFFWVARMVMAGYHFMGDRPFETVYLNGVVRDPQHRAFSKSLGNGIDPLDAVERFGADALRYTVVAGAAAGTDVIMDRDQMDGTFAAGRNFANKLWNIGRLLLSALPEHVSTLDKLDPAQMELADRWILSRSQRAVADATEALRRFRLNEAASLVYHFIWDELADWYLEQIKPRLYGSVPGGELAGGVAAYVLEVALRLLHPIMPFITEELWQHLPGEREALLAGAAWPAPDEELVDAEAEDQFGRVRALVGAIRMVRAEYGVAPGTEIRAFVGPANPEALQAFNAEQRTIERLAKLSRLSTDAPPEEAGAHQVLPDGSTVFVPLGDAIDVARECERLRGELERMDKQLAGVAAKLANRKFTSRAPAEVVEREREKERSWREQREALADKLRVLGC
jgi:valyl-tRNA synthetase